MSKQDAIEVSGSAQEVLPVKRGKPIVRKALIKGQLLFHATHGLCRVDKVNLEEGEIVYVLLPVLQQYAKARFLIPQKTFEHSGFNQLLAVSESQSLLDFFKNGKPKKAKLSPVWEMAVFIMAASRNLENAKDWKMRDQLNKSVKSIVGQLACSLKLNIWEICELIRDKLKEHSAINPGVLEALAKAESDCRLAE